MKDQYTGDINDYRKYGLLRIIHEVTKLQLGICWLKTPDDGRSDGGFRKYLDKPERYKMFDPPLFEALRELNCNADPLSDSPPFRGRMFIPSPVRGGLACPPCFTIWRGWGRNIKSILRTGILGNALSFDEIVPDDA